MAEENVIKIGALAKDLQLKTKDITNLLKDRTGVTKASSASLTEEEADVLIDAVAFNADVKDIDDLLRGDIIIYDEEAEKKAAA